MKQSLCESNRLVAFLGGALSEKAERELISHLDECASCAHELEQLAAEPSRWNEVRSHLSNSKRFNVSPTETIGESAALPISVRQVLGLLDPTDQPNSMGRMGSYEVMGVVGSGAMGVVLKAFDQTLDRVVALKVMNPTLASCGTARYRFAREAKAAAGVLHPNVIAIHGVSVERDLPFLVMPYIAGTSLQQRMDRRGPLDLKETLRIGNQIAAGLAAAHQQGLIHRDIKPSNVMLDEGVETAVITDFGLARTIDDATMTRTGSITGTPEFMSPEQARGDSVDCASDLFSLGSVLYALCTGIRPFRAKTPFGVLRKITDDQPRSIRDVNPEVPEWLCKLIEQMHSKSPGDRPSATQVRDLLENCLAHVYQPDRISLPKELAPKHSTRVATFSKNLVTGAILMMTAIFVTVLAFAMIPGSPTPEPINDARIVSKSGSEPTATPKNEPTVIPATEPTVVPVNDPSVFKTLNLMFPQVGQKGTLKIDINRGFIEVTGHDQPNVVIEILTPPEYEKSAQKDSEFIRVFNPKYDLDTIAEKNLIKLDTYNQNYVLNVRVKVPHKTDLLLDSYRDGYLKVNDVTGVIDAHSEHSDISLLNISGSATAFSRNGSLKIRFDDVASYAKLDFESYNGAIDLSLPPSVATTAAIASGSGSFLTAFELGEVKKDERPKSILDKVKSNVNEYQFGKINGGGVPMRIENAKGPIRIRKNTPTP